MRRLDAGALIDQLKTQVGEIARSSRAISDLTRLAFGQSDQIGHGIDARKPLIGRVDRHDEGRRYHHRNGCEIALRQIAELFIDLRIDRDAARVGNQQGVTIGRGTGHLGCAECAICTGPVLDHHRLAKLDANLLGQHPGNPIGGTAGRKSGDQTNRLAGPRLASGHRCEGGHQRRNRRPDQRSTRKSLACCHLVSPIIVMVGMAGALTPSHPPDDISAWLCCGRSGRLAGLSSTRFSHHCARPWAQNAHRSGGEASRCAA